MNLNSLSKDAARQVARGEFGLDEQDEHQVAHLVYQHLLRLPAWEQTHLSKGELLQVARHCAEQLS